MAAAEIQLFIDRDTWSRVLDSTLRDAGVPFVTHREHFTHDTPDVDWIAEAGRMGWVVVTRDQHIRRRANELAAVREARLHRDERFKNASEIPSSRGRSK